jgi:hypothetical protein
VRLSNIRMDADGVVTLDVRIGLAPIKTRAPAAKKAAPVKSPAKAKRKPAIHEVDDPRLTLPGMLAKKKRKPADKKPAARPNGRVQPRA